MFVVKNNKEIVSVSKGYFFQKNEEGIYETLPLLSKVDTTGHTIQKLGLVCLLTNNMIGTSGVYVIDDITNDITKFFSEDFNILNKDL